MPEPSPSICVFGAGAIGGLVAARLSAAGAVVSVAARGPHLAAMQARGLTLESLGRTITTRPRIVADPAALGPQDYIFVALKAHSLQPALPQMQALIGPQTTIIAAVNGLPWWYFYGVEGPLHDRRVRAVDPDGALWDGLPPAQTLGCVIYPAAEIAAPGVIRHTSGDRFSLGEPDGSSSGRAERISRMLVAAGLQAPVLPRIRDELWVKLWGSMAFNPISALTGATMDVMIGEPGSRGLARAVMLEGQAVGEALGVRFPIDVDQRLERGAQVGRHKTSMLQDLERGRPLEIEALLGSVVELAHWVGAPAPLASALLVLVRQRAAMRA